MAPWRSIRWLCPGLAFYFSATSAIAVSHGSTLENWLRDIISYMLLATIPVLVVDAAAGLGRRGAARLVAVAGLLGAVGFSVSWLSRRGVSDLPLAHLVFPSLALCVVPFAYALTKALTGRASRARWGLLATSILTFLLVTGTRTSVVFVVSLLAVVGRKSKNLASLARVAAIVVPLTIGVVAGVVLIAGHLVSNDEFLPRRLNALSAVFSTDGATRDESYLIRRQAYDNALDAWRKDPLFGAGPGYLYPTADGSGRSGTTLDTPYLILSKFGLVGTLVIAGYLLAFLMNTRRSRLVVGYSTTSTTVRTSTLIFIALFPFGQLLDDKGMPIGLALLLLLVIVDLRERYEPLHSHPQITDEITPKA